MTDTKAKPGTLENAIGHEKNDLPKKENPPLKPRKPRAPKAKPVEHVLSSIESLTIYELTQVRDKVKETLDERRKIIENDLKIIG